MCVALRAVSTIVCIYFFICVCPLYISSLIFSVFFTAGQPREFKHKLSEQKPSGWCSPLFPQYDTVGARMESFKKWPLSAECISEAAFFSSGTKFNHRACFVRKATIQLKLTNIVFLWQDLGISYPVSIVDSRFKIWRTAIVYGQNISNIILIVFTYSRKDLSMS